MRARQEAAGGGEHLAEEVTGPEYAGACARGKACHTRVRTRRRGVEPHSPSSPVKLDEIQNATAARGRMHEACHVKAHLSLDLRVVNLGINLPPLLASARFAELGAQVTKVEPPRGDPMQRYTPALYARAISGQEIHRLDLKQSRDQAELDEILVKADVMITSSRPSALRRLGLDAVLLERHRRLVHVAIVGYGSPYQEVSGHDLTYSAPLGLIAPPCLPRTLVADIGGAERAVSAGLAAVIARDSEQPSDRYFEVALADAAALFALPWNHGVTARDGLLGGGNPFYNVYEAEDGWIALGALEPEFQRNLLDELGLNEGDLTALAACFRRRPTKHWVSVAAIRDIPIAPVHDLIRGDTKSGHRDNR